MNTYCDKNKNFKNICTYMYIHHINNYQSSYHSNKYKKNITIHKVKQICT